MKRWFFFLAFIGANIIGNAVYGQVAPSIEWQECFGGSEADFAVSIQQTTDSGYIVAGYSESIDGDVSGNQGQSDWWILKLGITGDLIWQKSLGGSNYDQAWSVQQTTDGGFILAGNSSSNDGDVSGYHGNKDYWIVKLDTGGNLVWQKCLGGGNLDYAFSVQQTNDGGFIVAGNSCSNNGDVSGNHGSTGDYWLVKLDTIGDLEWQKCLGGSKAEEAHSVQQTADSGYIVAGKSSSNNGDVSGNHEDIYGTTYDYWITKLSADGSLTWEKNLGGSGWDEPYSIQQTADGGFIVAGYSNSNDGDVSGNNSTDDYYDFWVVKLDTAGNLVWQKMFGRKLE